jgi:hypothetical protein
VTFAPLFLATSALFVIAMLIASIARNGRPHPNLKSHGEAETYVRTLRFGSRRLSEQTRLLVRFAPLNSPGTAAECADASGSFRWRIPVADVRSVRVWLRGRAVTSAGAPDLGSTQFLRPLSWPVARWEAEVVTWAGDVVRCYGTGAAELDVARLRRLVAVQHRASAALAAGGPAIRTRPPAASSAAAI